jgi:hypothetical protein
MTDDTNEEERQREAVLRSIVSYPDDDPLAELSF